MNDTLLEQVSSLVDNEPEPGLGKNIDHLLKSPELRQTWQSYHQLGDWMRGAADGKVVRVDVVDRVRLAIEAEPAILIPVRSVDAPVEPAPVAGQVTSADSSPRGWSQVVGIGIAAAVASLTVLLFQQNNFLGLDHSASVLASSESSAAIRVTDLSVPNGTLQGAQVNQQGQTTQLAVTSATFQEKLDAYLVSHVKQSAANGVQGMLPFARVVNHGTGSTVSQGGVGQRGQ